MQESVKQLRENIFVTRKKNIRASSCEQVFKEVSFFLVERN